MWTGGWSSGARLWVISPAAELGRYSVQVSCSVAVGRNLVRKQLHLAVAASLDIRGDP
jgi:hypothetical protein